MRRPLSACLPALFGLLLLLAPFAAPPAAAQGSAKSAPAFREITWETLLPKDWDPMAPFKGLDLTRLNDRDPRAIEAMEKLQAAWAEAPVEASLRGAKVRLPGFIIPLDRDGDLVSELLLVPYFGACIHTPPPPANQIVHVVLKKPLKGLRMMDPYWIDGTLDLARGDTGIGVYGYRLKAEAMQPYVEKKK